MQTKTSDKNRKGKLNSPVGKGLSKGLMAVPSPIAHHADEDTQVDGRPSGIGNAAVRAVFVLRPPQQLRHLGQPINHMPSIGIYLICRPITVPQQEYTPPVNQ
eukprot:4631706-Pyramimonas_sp.AAC.1